MTLLPSNQRANQPQYTSLAPPLDGRNAETIVQLVTDRLADYGWRGQEGSPGMALTQLFGRLAELIIVRLNQVPDNHFLSFLNEAGIEPLPPQSASSELSFSLPDDYEGFVRVPAGTQAATIQTETQPELIFETQQEVNIAPGTLVKCIAFDPINFGDYTAQAKGDAVGPFAVFQGQLERERILYVGDNELLAFSDAATRQAAAITLKFLFAAPGEPALDGWTLQWLHWDAAAEAWVELSKSGAVITDQNQENTNEFSKDGTVVFTNLPAIGETEVDGKAGLWIAGQLTGGKGRDYLPAISGLEISRVVSITTDTVISADTAFSAIQSGAAFVPLNPDGEFFPLGQRPGRLDTFYVRSDEAFSKQGATVAIQLSVEGLPPAGQIAAPTELDNLRLAWEYHGVDGWQPLGTSARTGNPTDVHLNFSDVTQALTITGSGAVQFTVPESSGNEPLFAPTDVNDQEGYWVRARVIAGSYDEPGGMSAGNSGVQTWTEPRTHKPLITSLKVAYQGYNPLSQPNPNPMCVSRVDNIGRDHQPNLIAGTPFTPFTAKDEGPALYLGFSAAFPADQWMQLLFDVAEDVRTSWDDSNIFWEYWGGDSWEALRVSDGTRRFNERGYLGFYGPEAHPASVEFGATARWIRARLPVYPKSSAGRDQKVTVSGGPATISLDASASQTFDGNSVAAYHWRLVSSSPPDADPGAGGTFTSGNPEAVVTLDASGSRPATGLKYIWRRVEAEEPDEAESIATPYLNSIRTNIVSALNAITVREEVMGSSDGKPGQTFSLLRTPVLPGIQIAIKEPDRPPVNELEQLEWELQQVDEEASALPDPAAAAPGQGVWTRWHQVEDFHSSTSYSRHFTLDAISGRIKFGDGIQGKIPPVGRDNVKALVYRTHNGYLGNVTARNITVMRNPSGDLANIKTVTNHEATGGGSAEESVGQVKRRGPQALKHRHRAVTLEDYEWLAREAGGDLARIRCLPTLNSLGLPEAGWVTVVITPESTLSEKKPTPTPALLRRVESYLKERTLANLTTSDQIHLKGPEYIEATVTATIVATDPQLADEVEIAVLQRLDTFLHPLYGGPTREGWRLGRDVFISEIYAEIEAVDGVDHVSQAALCGTVQQFRINLERETGGYRQAPFDVPIGTQVSTFDERIKLLLAEQLRDAESVSRLSVYGFKVGDLVSVVGTDNAMVRDNLTIATLSNDQLTFVQPFVQPSGWAKADALLSADGRFRVPLTPGGEQKDNDNKIVGLGLLGFQPGDAVCVVPVGHRPPELEFLRIESIEACQDRIFIPEGHLVFSGNHDIDMALE